MKAVENSKIKRVGLLMIALFSLTLVACWDDPIGQGGFVKHELFAVDDDFEISFADGVLLGNVLQNDSSVTLSPMMLAEVWFGSNVANFLNQSSVTLRGDHGTLVIEDDGTFSYLPDEDAFERRKFLRPKRSDVTSGTSEFSRDGFTVQGPADRELSWMEGLEGNGIGTEGNQIFGSRDRVIVRFESTDSVGLTLGDIGSEDIGGAVTFILHRADGEQVNLGYIQRLPPSNGIMEVLITSDRTGGTMTGIEVLSPTDLENHAIAFLLNEVTVYTKETQPATKDRFTYVVVNNVGDFSLGFIDISVTR